MDNDNFGSFDDMLGKNLFDDLIPDDDLNSDDGPIPIFYEEIESQVSNIEILIDGQRSTSRKESYGHGKEHESIKKHPDYDRPYDNCYLYKQFQMKLKDIKELGKWYNIDFKKYFKDENSDFVAFSREAYRKKNIGFWFFQRIIDNEKTKNIILPWINIQVQKLI